MNFFSKEIILGLTVQEFLLHLLNLVIIIIAVRLLLYKPIQKFMEKRKQEYAGAEDEHNKALDDAQKIKIESDAVIASARDEAVRIVEEASALALVQTGDILDGAKEEAQEIINRAKEEAVKIRAAERENLVFSVADIAVEISQKLLGRELKEEDNDAYVQNIVEGIKSRNA